MKFREAIDNYMNFVRVMRSEGTIRYFNGKIQILKLYLGDYEVDKINSSILYNFILQQRERNEKISNSTLNKYIGVIKQILKKECNIILEFEKLREVRKIIPTVPDRVVEKIFKHYKTSKPSKYNLRNHLFFRILYDTGLRINELLNLQFKHINIDSCTIHVHITKTDNERYVFFTAPTKRLILQFIQMIDSSGYVFTDFKCSKLEYDTIIAIQRRLSNKLKINESITPHKWRHTFATRFLRNGGDLESLRIIMGHASLKTTQKYLYLDLTTLSRNYMKVMG